MTSEPRANLKEAEKTENSIHIYLCVSYTVSYIHIYAHTSVCFMCLCM